MDEYKPLPETCTPHSSGVALMWSVAAAITLCFLVICDSSVV